MAKKKNKQKGNPNSSNSNKGTQAAANNSSQSKSEPKNNGKGNSMAKNIAVAALIILLLLAGIGFLIFGLVQSVSDNDNDQNTESNEDGDNNNEGDEGDNNDGEGDGGSVNGDAVSDSNDGEEGDTNGEGQAVVDEDDSAATPPGATSDLNATNAARFPVTNVAYRRGNDYKYGDISGNSYAVKRGDTLWQIAEARYGSGYAWTEINKANGGFKNLPNGRPVLITPGQTIILPEL